MRKEGILSSPGRKAALKAWRTMRKTRGADVGSKDEMVGFKRHPARLVRRVLLTGGSFNDLEQCNRVPIRPVLHTIGDVPRTGP